jgi:choline dehydrogenase-like flavoprotein
MKSFKVTGARETIHGSMGIGLHLMGGCGMGTDPARTVVNPEFRLHGFKNIYCADSSIFPNAPGINPSLTIMALSKKAAAQLVKDGNR